MTNDYIICPVPLIIAASFADWNVPTYNGYHQRLKKKKKVQGGGVNQCNFCINKSLNVLSEKSTRVGKIIYFLLCLFRGILKDVFYIFNIYIHFFIRHFFIYFEFAFRGRFIEFLGFVTSRSWYHQNQIDLLFCG